MGRRNNGMSGQWYAPVHVKLDVVALLDPIIQTHSYKILYHENKNENLKKNVSAINKILGMLETRSLTITTNGGDKCTTQLYIWNNQPILTDVWQEVTPCSFG